MSEDWRSSAGTPGTILSIMQIVKKPICHQARGVDPMLGAGATVELRGDLTHPPHLAVRCIISLIMIRMLPLSPLLPPSCMDESHRCHPDFLQGTAESFHCDL